MKAYSVELDNQPVTVLDPDDKPYLELAAKLVRRFGSRRLGEMAPYGELTCQPSETRFENRTIPATRFSKPW